MWIQQDVSSCHSLCRHVTLLRFNVFRAERVADWRQFTQVSQTPCAALGSASRWLRRHRQFAQSPNPK